MCMFKDNSDQTNLIFSGLEFIAKISHFEKRLADSLFCYFVILLF